MIFFREINPLSAKLLKRIYCQSKKLQVRQRAPCLLLANQGTKVENLMQIFQVSRKTIYNWFERWESEGLVGLYNKPGRGRKPTFNSEQKAKIKEWTEQEPRQLKQVLVKVEDEWGIKSSKKTLQRVLKTLKMSWHRMRKAVGGKPEPDEYQQKKAQLEEFKQLENAGKINLYYLDEVGLALLVSVWK